MVGGGINGGCGEVRHSGQSAHQAQLTVNTVQMRVVVVELSVSASLRAATKIIKKKLQAAASRK